MTGTLVKRGPLTPWTVAALGAAATTHLLLGLRRLRRRPLPPGLSLRSRMEAVAEAFLPRPIARFAATEALLLFWALHWRARPDIPAGATPVDYHRGARPLLWVLAGAGLVELVVLHVIALVFWGPKLAWPLFALSEVGLVYGLGLISSLDKLPILVFDNRIEVRVGLLATHVIPRENIRAIGPSVLPQPGDTSVLKASLAAEPSIAIALVTPISVRSLKRHRTVEIRTIALRPDDPDHFLRATAHLVPPARP